MTQLSEQFLEYPTKRRSVRILLKVIAGILIPEVTEALIGMLAEAIAGVIKLNKVGG